MALPFVPAFDTKYYFQNICEAYPRYLLTHSKALDKDINNEITKSGENYVVPENIGMITGHCYSYLNVNAKSFTFTSKLNPYAMPFSLLTKSGYCKEVVDDTCTESPYTILQSLRVKNIDTILIGHLNVNSIRNKFHTISDLIKGKCIFF